MRQALLEAASYLATQVSSEQGTLRAFQGAQQRISEPHAYDMAFPVMAFLLVIVVPSLVALWVIVKTVTDPSLEEGES